MNTKPCNCNLKGGVSINCPVHNPKQICICTQRAMGISQLACTVHYPSQKKEQDWQKEFDSIWGIAPKGTPKYERGKLIKQFIWVVRREAQAECEAFFAVKERRIKKQEREQAKVELLRELIAIWKPRDPLEQYTTNVILLELEARLNELDNKLEE